MRILRFGTVYTRCRWMSLDFTVNGGISDTLTQKAALEWELEQMRRAVVESLEAEDIEIPACIKESFFGELQNYEFDNCN